MGPVALSREAFAGGVGAGDFEEILVEKNGEKLENVVFRSLFGFPFGKSFLSESLPRWRNYIDVKMKKIPFFGSFCFFRKL